MRNTLKLILIQILPSNRTRIFSSKKFLLNFDTCRKQFASPQVEFHSIISWSTTIGKQLKPRSFGTISVLSAENSKTQTRFWQLATPNTNMETISYGELTYGELLGSWKIFMDRCSKFSNFSFASIFSRGIRFHEE